VRITGNIQTRRVGKMQGCFILHQLVCSSDSKESKILVAKRGGRTSSAPASCPEIQEKSTLTVIFVLFSFLPCNCEDRNSN